MNNALTLIIAAFKKLGLALLFLLMGVTWTLVNPLIKLAMGASFYNQTGTSPFQEVGAATWVVSLVYIAIGVMLLLRKYKPSVKIPEIAYTVAIGACALFALIDVFSISQVFTNELQHFDQLHPDMQSHIVLSYVSAILNFVALAAAVALLLLKKKLAKFALLPGGVYALSTLLLAIRNISTVIKRKDWIEPRYQPDYVTGIIFGLMFSVALLFFCFFFVAQQAATPENVAVAETAEESDLLPELAASQTPETNAAGGAQTLTQRQKEDLENAKELFELGAIDEAEYEAEKQRIMLGL